MAKKDHPFRGGKFVEKYRPWTDYGRIKKNVIDRVRKYDEDYTPHHLIAKEYGLTVDDVAHLCKDRPRNPKKYCLCGCGKQLIRKIGEKPSDFHRRGHVDRKHSGAHGRKLHKTPEERVLDDVKLSVRWLMSREAGHTSDLRLWAWRELLGRYR